VWSEIVRRIRASEARHLGGFIGVHIAPDGTGDIPDSEGVRLVVLHPSQAHSRGDDESAALRFAREAFDKRGSGQRVNRNMVVFLAPDTKRLEELDTATRDYLAWDWISDRIDELNLSPQQAKQVEVNRARSDDTASSRIAATYYWVLVPEQPDPTAPAVITVEKAEGANERLAPRVTDKLTRAGLLTSSVAARSLRLDLDQKLGAVWDTGHIRVGDLWGYYCRYPYLTRLRDRSVLDDGVLSVLSDITWESEGFALADGFDEASGKYPGLVLPSGDGRFGQITDATLLVAPAVAVRQMKEEAESTPEVSPSQDTDIDPAKPGVKTPVPAQVHNVRFFGVYKVDPERYGRDLTRLSQEILQQLSAVDGVELAVSVEVHARSEAGFPDDKVRIVLENARTLKFEQSSFEDE
jgi:hypothetical protein